MCHRLVSLSVNRLHWNLESEERFSDILVFTILRLSVLLCTQCTGVAVERFQQSSWCCFFSENPIGVKSGSNILIHKPEVQTGCLFGFDTRTNCSKCATDLGYDVSIFNGTLEEVFPLTITFSGDECTQIRGIFSWLLFRPIKISVSIFKRTLHECLSKNYVH